MSHCTAQSLRAIPPLHPYLFVLLVVCCWLIAIPCLSQTADQGSQPIGILVTPSAQTAQEILTKLRAGWDFGVLARENSSDRTAEDGGYLGLLSPSELQPQLRSALSGVKAGQYSDVVQIPSGFAILTVFPRIPAFVEADRVFSEAEPVLGAIASGIRLSGYNQANLLFNQFPKPEGWDQDLPAVCELHKKSYEEGIKALLERLQLPPPNDGQDHTFDRLGDLVALGQLYSYTGQMTETIQQFSKALDLARPNHPDGVAALESYLGAAWLHEAELENKVFESGGDLDFFPPIHPKARFAKPEASEKAISYFKQYLENDPDDLSVRWLLNLAYATLGEYPEGVPSAQLIPPAEFRSMQNVGPFSDIAHKVGLDASLNAGGVVVGDFENNGRLDIVLSSMNSCETLHYFHNNGDGTFSDHTAQAGLLNQLGGLNVTAADYNNDGCLDLLVLRGGWEVGVRRSLLRNNCDGTFTDVTRESGLASPVASSQSAVWADIDHDGLLDLFIANENAPSQLFRNRGDGTFEDVSHAAGIDRVAISKGVTAADYDNDGYVDFYVSNMAGPNFLYRNNHDGTFTEIARQAGVREPYFGFATWFFDYDNDGWPDLFVASYGGTVDDAMRSNLHLPFKSETMKIYHNLRNGTFEDVTSKVGLDRVMMPMGANFGDIDNDGFEDIYLGMGNPSLAGMTPHVLLRNDEGKQFVDITESSGTGELHKGHGIAFADLWRNGQLEVVAQCGGAVPSDRHSVRLFQNPGNRNNWINIRLVGVKSNRNAIGAKIKVITQTGNAAPRTIWRTVGETSSFGGNPLEQHIGLGPDARILSVDIDWPATTSHQHFEHLAADEFIEIKEFATSYARLVRKPISIDAATAPAQATRGRGGP